MFRAGEVAEWPIAPVSKTGLPARVAGVQIPPSPLNENLREIAGSFNLMTYVISSFTSEPRPTANIRFFGFRIRFCGYHSAKPAKLPAIQQQPLDPTPHLLGVPNTPSA